MKRKNGPTVNLKAFLEKAAAKKRTQEATGPSQPSCISPSQPSCIESQMQVVIYQGQPENESDIGASSPTTVPLDVENDDIGGGPNDESSSDEDNNGGVYDIEHDPGLRTPISQYDVNDQDSIALTIMVEMLLLMEVLEIGTLKVDLVNMLVLSIVLIVKLKRNTICSCNLRHQFGLAFRGHDESKDSNNKGNFRELVQWLTGNFEEVNKVVLGNAPTGCQMIDHKIQKQLIGSCAHETTKLVIEELHDECFAILADESSDAYQQEQLALCLRFVNTTGQPVERFLGLVHVEDTTSLTLKEAIKSLLIKYQLPLSRVRGQGYDGASNMKGHINGLKKLIMDESPSAYYVHCFVHQLQLTLVAVAKENTDCAWFFGQLAYLLNVLGMSCKKIRMLRIAQAEYMIEALKLGDTRWGSHYKTVMHVMLLYPSIKKVLFKVGKECNGAEAIGAQTMLQVFQSFEFVFLLHMMNEIFGYTSDFCNALQRREQDIVNAMDLLEFTKAELDVLREDCGWKEFLGKVTSFCVKHKVKVVDMDGKQLQELNNRFDEVNTELLRCMASFSPAKSFSAFNVDNLVKLAKFYPSDFDVEEMNQLPFQLNRYISDVGKDENFTNLRSLADLSMMLVKTNKVSRYDLVYRLLKLVLVLPVATAGVERVFSSMNYIKNKLRSKMGQEYLNDCLVTFIERDFFLQVKDKDIINHFQNIKKRKVLL
ncbi:uncharacterized protein LOC127782037 [Oryza glaberrima]|uniref:uncharacterized protein LOC127782037 n=1 Tax=Oryza glaberrima TaxID=4538 RepID=UPI00224C59D3|nr:uncharacterized protein LOC127782037 [Oryza glaberrima]